MKRLRTKNMVAFSRLLSTDVQDLLVEKYGKIKTQTSGFNQSGELVKELTYTLVDQSEPFDIERFLSTVRPISMRYKINFGVSYILREEEGLRYYHASHNNSRLLSTAFVVTEPDDLIRFKHEFARDNWIDLDRHTLLRPNTKAKPVCLASITFWVYLVDGVYQFVGAPQLTSRDILELLCHFTRWQPINTINIKTICVFLET